MLTRAALRKALELAPIGPDGNKIRTALAFTGKRQSHLCRATGLAPSSISLIVTGKNDPSLPTAHVIAQFFGVPIETLFPAIGRESEVA